MDKFLISGGSPLKGVVTIAGAKNAALPAMAASLLTSEPVHLRQVPDVRDIKTLGRLLEHMGARPVRRTSGESSELSIQVSSLLQPEAPWELVRTMRASILTLGPLLARAGRARVSLPGGCAIGERPVDLHISALEDMGAEIDISHGYIQARARKLRGAEIAFSQVTVTGTENIMMAACLADGTTLLRNCAKEPEVRDLGRLLESMGARIRGAGTDTIEVEGRTALHGTQHTILPDRIEAGTFILAGLLAGEDVVVKNCNVDDLATPLTELREAGGSLEKVDERTLRVRRGDGLMARDMTTSPYPGFPTDLQAQYMACMTQARGRSLITESIFENRFMHIGELRRMGADISHEGRVAAVRGPTRLSGAQVMATDLRASACLVLAGLVAEGTTEVNRVYHIDRGYERIEVKLGDLGANVARIRE